MMSTAFLQSLADMLGTTEAEARQALAGFVAALHARVEAEGSATYAGLGTFRRTGNALTFEPDPAVALVVNHRYAGMEPISLSGGAPPSWQAGLPDDEHPLGPPPPEVFEPADAEPVDAEPADDEPADDEPADLPPLFASDETLMALRDAARDLDTPPSEEAAQWADDMIEAEEESPAPPSVPDDSVLQEVHLADEPPEPAPPPPADEHANPFHEPLPDDDAAAFDEAETTEEAGAMPPPAAVPPATVPPVPEPAASERAAPSRPAEPPSRRPAPPDRRRNAWPFILLAVLAGIAVMSWFLIGQRAETPVAPPAARTDSAASPLDTAAVAAADTAAADTTAPPPPPEEGPLRGTAPVTAGSGYTLVVGGADSEAEANELAVPFRNAGYRTGVIRGRTGAGATIYRVSVGTFTSLAQAERALNEVRGTAPFPADTWVRRL